MRTLSCHLNASVVSWPRRPITFWSGRLDRLPKQSSVYPYLSRLPPVLRLHLEATSSEIISPIFVVKVTPSQPPLVCTTISQTYRNAPKKIKCRLPQDILIGNISGHRGNCQMCLTVLKLALAEIHSEFKSLFHESRLRLGEAPSISPSSSSVICAQHVLLLRCPATNIVCNHSSLLNDIQKKHYVLSLDLVPSSHTALTLQRYKMTSLTRTQN